MAYFTLYVVFTVAVKYLMRDHGMDGISVLVYTTLGGSGIVLPIILVQRWYRLESNGSVTKLGLTFPQEYLYIIPSGVCTAVVIPTTTLMYTLPITVMVAMTIMRASVIVISRVVDEVQIRQGILRKRVYREENIAVVLALAAVSVHVVEGARTPGSFDFLSNPAAMVILGLYVSSYAARIYIMNYFKNTRAVGVKLDNKGFFSVEQFAAVATLIVGTALIWWLGGNGPRATTMRAAFETPVPTWGWAVLAGAPFGLAAFFSVFIFMFRGRTATFAGLVNRLTSLIAGTVATLIFWLAFGGRAAKSEDWTALVIILVAVGFLTVAERKRAAEVARAG